MLRVDPEKMEEQLAAMQKAMAEHTDKPGTKGCIARMQTQALPALFRWRMGEMNRDADPNDVANALVGLFSCVLFSEATSVYGGEVDDDHFNFINNILHGLAEEMVALLEGTRTGVKSHYVPPSVAGTC